MRHAARRDRNEAPIVDALRKLGVQVYRLDDPGFPDLACWRQSWTQLVAVEVKDHRAKLTPAQAKYLGPRWIIRSVNRALEAVRLWDRGEFEPPAWAKPGFREAA